MLDFEHVFRCSQFSCCSLHSLTLFALTFLCVSHSNLVIFCSVPNLPHLCQFVHSFALHNIIIFDWGSRYRQVRFPAIHSTGTLRLVNFKQV
jgi:hypothetical protein